MQHSLTIRTNAGHGARVLSPPLLVALLLVALTTTGCAEDPATPAGAGSSASGTTANGSGSEAAAPRPPEHMLAADPRATPDWFDGPRAKWPALVATHDADLRGFGVLDGGVGFLGRTQAGELLALTSNWYLSPDAGLTAEIDLAYFEQLVKRWELRSDPPGDGIARLTGRARSGLEAPGADILLLSARAVGDAPLPCAVLALSERVPAIGEALIVVGTGGLVVDTSLSAYAPAAGLTFDLPPGTPVDGLLGGPVLDASGSAVACVTMIDWDGEGDVPGPAEPVRAVAQALRPFLLAPPPLIGAPVRLENPGYDQVTLSESGGLMFMGNAVLAGATVMTWPDAQPFAGAELPKGEGAGAFTDAGWLVTAGRGGTFSVFDTVSRTALVTGDTDLPVVTAICVLDERRALFGSSFSDRCVLVDLTLGATLEEFDFGATAFALSPDRAELAVGGADGAVFCMRVRRDTTGSILSDRTELAGHTESVVALAWSRDGDLLASGSWDDAVRVSRRGSAQELWTSSGASDVNDVWFDEAARLWVATGSTEDQDGIRAPTACYVRVFRGLDGLELLRSHDQPTAVVALIDRSDALGDESAAGFETRVLGLTVGPDHFHWTAPAP